MKQTRRAQRRPRKPLAVEVVIRPEPMNFAAWADQYAAVVIRLYRQNRAQAAAA